MYMLTCINVQLIFDGVQIADVALRIVFLLLLRCFFLPSFRLGPAAVLTLKRSEMSAIFFHNQNKSTSSPGLLGNGALTCRGLHF